MDWRDHSIRMGLRFGPALLIVLSFVAILLGIIFNATSINELTFREPPAKYYDPNVVIDDKFSDLVWFLQVTDLHISNREGHQREVDFAEFAKSYVDIFKPDAILVTGDITDGRIPNTTFATAPQLDEWIAYSGAIANSGSLSKTTWLDIRGNHDNFNVYRPKEPSTLYRQYSIQGKKHARNYMHILKKGGKKYSFIGVDEVQTPGLKIPFNFIGIVGDDDLEELKKFKEDSRRVHNSQYHIWFAHYPTSSIASPHEGLRNIVDGPYLCGHFHTIGDMVLKMHATQQPGYVEVELGDWKYNRRIRLSAIDHQLFSLVDFKFKQFPVALMTNPKNAEYVMPKYEPTPGRLINSTHIRVIAFSNASITSVELSIDGKEKQSLKQIEGPLYVLNWNPKDYLKGLHRAKIFVKDSEGKSISYTQSFSMDNSKDEASLGAKLLLRAYFKSSVIAIFFFIITVCTLPLVLLKVVVYQNQTTGLKRHYRDTFVYNLHLLCKINRLLWPLLIIPLWIAAGPHFIGYMVDEAIGVCFVWGVLIDGTFIHTGITYNVSTIFILLVHIPTVILLTNQVSDNYKAILTSNKPISTINLKFLTQLALTVLQSLMGYMLYSAYGAMALITSFPFVWCMLIYYYCWFQCRTIVRTDFTQFESSAYQEEQQALTGQRRDDKSSTSDHSTC